MSGFKFDGVIPASKSHFNRALICASYASDPSSVSPVHLHGDSKCDDVQKMKQALVAIGSERTIDCGSAGTVLRFLIFRASRLAGQHELVGSKRLMSRPQEDLKEIFDQLGVKISLHPERITVDSAGWRLGGMDLRVSRDKSSQFASGVLLNAWDLDFPLTISWSQVGVSEGYWDMTVQLVKDFGMELEQSANAVFIPAGSKVKIREYTVESDLSSAFAIAAYAALNGEATFRQFPFASLQPDKVFVAILEKMGVGVDRGEDQLRIFRRDRSHPLLSGVQWNLNNCPDLFPVLATLCAFARGPSRLDGAPHLVFKESNRIAKTAELIQHLGVRTVILDDGMEIHPPPRLVPPTIPFAFDPDHDHRLAFAAALVESQGIPIRILERHVVDKSFPEFWDILKNNSHPS